MQGLSQSFERETNHDDANKVLARDVYTSMICIYAAVSRQPGKGSLSNPTTYQNRRVFLLRQEAAQAWAESDNALWLSIN